MSRTREIHPAGGAAVRDGFTLIELMVVLMVMAVLSAAIVPSLVAAIRRAGAQSAASRVRDVLEFGSTAAIARRQPVTVQFDTDRRACWVSVRRTRLPWRETGDEEAGEGQTLISVQLPESIEMTLLREMPLQGSERQSLEQEAIRFWPDGTAETAVIEIADPDGDRYLVGVRGETGQVKLAEEQEETE